MVMAGPQTIDEVEVEHHAPQGDADMRHGTPTLIMMMTLSAGHAAVAGEIRLRNAA
jgi:hypothetical protein